MADISSLTHNPMHPRRAIRGVRICAAPLLALAMEALAQPAIVTVDVPAVPAATSAAQQGDAMIVAPAEPPTIMVQVPATASSSAPLPPTLYVGAVAGEELLALLRAHPRFGQVSKDLVGSPISIQVSQSFESTAGGTASAFASALLTGSTLGLIPMVTNNDLVITWEVAVNGTVLSRYRYRNNFTRVDSIYAGGTDTTYGLGKEGLAWVRSTTQNFIDDLAKDAKVDALIAEHAFYFGPAAGGMAAR